MAIKVLMPALSPTMSEGTINKWLVKVGDIVSAGDVLAEIETDKATMEVEAVDEGKITHIVNSKSDELIKVNSVIALIDGNEEDKIEDYNYSSNTEININNNLQTDNNKIMEIGQGGLSGQPLKERSTEVIKYLSQKSNNSFPIIGVGGIHSAEDALEKLDAGASLVQLYTGFVYEGPNLIKNINKAILKKLGD